ncbi:hypothetical protein [Xenorhabdus sp. PB62.4]|uniref:hypothetical protein n=1 Tax=Xenorhabdus sp. PB62.4 TaxID=1851573 RepID=UPI0016571203|nr:hypothetical protein [Xenorhabdus sp. PB62.4]MBC8954047.1 hypothetical protein [Xenorhabdus sp. PB62.4]
MHMQKYQMAVLVPSYDENSSEYPNKKVWFDASEWLKTPQYIKVSDFFIINKKFTPIDNLDTLKMLSITTVLQDEIDNSREFSDLSELKNIGMMDFLDLMKDKINYEYIYSEFNEESLKPLQDFFLVKFIHKEKKYELFIRRSFSDGEYVYDHFNPIYRENEWHKRNKNIMTYRDYLEGKIDSYKQ